MADPRPTESATADPVERLWGLWQQGQRPDVDTFLAGAGPLAPARVAAALRVDQRQRWLSGERVPVEDYLRRHPAVRADRESALDLIFNEFLLREQLGEQPTADEYVERFPEYRDVLPAQVELYRALAADPSAAGRAPAGTPTAPGGSVTPVTGPSAPASQTEPVLPPVFGRYRILRVLGRGGMATVYLAHDTDLGRDVALKVPRFGQGEDGSLAQRFLREARITANLRHPLLCPVYDVGRAGGILYLTMPVVHGEPLSARLHREGPLPQQTAARLTAAIARAVAVAHQAGVIHRDLKPANIMMTEEGEPVIMDFGLARRHVTDDPRVTTSGIILGTPAYLPPEQIGGDPDAVGPAADVYSLGVILYEMLAGRLPFAGSSHEILTQTLTRPPDPPRRYRADLDPALEAICLTAIAKAPAARFASMTEFAQALEGYLRNGREAPTPVPQAPMLADATHGPPAPAAHRHTRRRGVAALLGLAAVVVGGVLWLTLPRPARDPVQAGTRWSGTYSWRRHAPDARPEDARLTVTERSGNALRGVYATLGGKFEWEVTGTVEGGQVRWDFTRALKGGPLAQAVVGKAAVTGSCAGDDMDLVYDDGQDVADMDLHREK
jgi:hypothetical protein